MNNITIIGDYRLAFIKAGNVVGHELVNMGPSMGSLAKYHSWACPMVNRFPQEDKEGCRCKRWYSWLRKELNQKTH